MAKYRRTSRDKIIERANARKNQGNGSKCLTFKNLPKDMKVEFFKPTKSIHNLDIIGYVITDPQNPECDDTLEPGYLWYGRNYWVHRGIGADDGMVVCPAKTFTGERCPICEYAKQRRASGEASKEELDALKPKQRQLFNVIDRDGDPDVVKLMDLSYHLFGKQLDKEILDSDDDEVSAFFEPEDGFTLRVRFDKKSFNGREFFECDRIDFKDRKKQYKESIIDETYPLDDILNKLSYDQLNELFVMGAEINSEESLPETQLERDERKKEKERERRRQREREREAEVEDEDVEEEEKPRGRGRKRDEAEDEDEAPARGRNRRVTRGSEDDGDEDEPAPRSSRKKPAENEDDGNDDKKPARGNRRRQKQEESEDEVAKNDDADEVPEKPGRGRRVRPEPDEEEDDKPAKPNRRAKADKETADGECPEGMRWGKDCDSDDCCDDCKVWAGCNAASRKK